MKAVDIGLGVDTDRSDTQTPRRARDADGDLTAIGYEELGDHVPLSPGIGPAATTGNAEEIDRE